MSFNFGEVLNRAWQITWKYKILWIFGILAGCSEGSGGARGGGGNGGNGNGNNPLPQQYQFYMDALSRWLAEHWWIVVLVVAALFLLVILAIFLGTIGRIGLIRGTLEAEAGAQSMAFSPLFNGSMPYFWRVFGLGLLFGIAAFIIVGSLLMGGIITIGIGFICIGPLLCLLIPVFWILNLILEQAYVAIVKENLDILDGWKRGWNIVRLNIGSVIVMGLILAVISFVISLIVALPVILLFIPAAITVAAGNGQDMTPLLIAGTITLLYLPILILLRGILATYKGSAWTLTYLRLTSPAHTEILPPPAEPPVEANA